MHTVKWKEPTWNVTGYMIPTVWYLAKAKLKIKTKKTSVVSRSSGEEGRDKYRRLLGLWNCSVRYCYGGYMPYICQNSKKIQH